MDNYPNTRCIFGPMFPLWNNVGKFTIISNLDDVKDISMDINWIPMTLTLNDYVEPV